MKTLALALLLAAVPAASTDYSEMPPGRYSMALTGLVSTVCARAVVAEWSRLPEVEKVTVDFDAEKAEVLVRLDRTLRVTTLRKALRRAEKLSRLGGRYDLKDIIYKP